MSLNSIFEEFPSTAEKLKAFGNKVFDDSFYEFRDKVFEHFHYTPDEKSEKKNEAFEGDETR